MSSSTEISLTTNGFTGFASLVQVLGTSTGTNEKTDALSYYFTHAADEDKVWVIAIFSGRRPKRVVNSTLLQNWCAEITGLPVWLFEECYHTVGDLGETIALLLPEPDIQGQQKSLSWYIDALIRLSKAEEPEKKQFITDTWRHLNREERFVFNKLITGGFRIGVSQKVMVNALSKTVQMDAPVIAHRISGNWDPGTTKFSELLNNEGAAADHSKPYPFYLAYALDKEPAALGDPQEWQAEWKWDGIRGQIIKRNRQLFVWSRGEELMTDKFPEYQVLENLLPDGTVLDGEILPGRGDTPLPFSVLQTRIGRKNVSKKQLQEAPVVFYAYDLLEYDGVDIRDQPLETRRKLLEQIVNDLSASGRAIPVFISPVISFKTWEALAAIRERSRELGAEGLMLKRIQSAYQVGRKIGDWWKWKMDALTIDAVMVYAQKGHGRRSNLYTDYTFAVQDGDKLVTFTKAYSGLTDKEFAQVDAFVKRNSLEKFGPVRTVKPELVFEIAFEGIAASNRHKSGVALRFPRISRWRKDKTPGEINTLADLKQLLDVYGK
ncbi:ATP-dependent DNA ligase [Sediminibacterium ginsengisoli]|uniref:DNA ligase (ATP) n=1 Tax=Sediminibacterium ginsengisoli TaxID=413434 RepID=A0A1T4P986_9BACT|nr:ATP-dependent DNA ligase [Sediminibacterium ginsengisoli]SJZ87951.1 DNA ligase-1 [Sediminibacterium ginsengisoli]